MAKKGFDRASGQVYTDSVIPSFIYPSDAAGPSWSHESPFLPPGWEEGSPCGANTLKHMAMRKTLLDQRPLTAGHFADCPWELAKYLWDCLGRCRRRTMHMWKIFSTAYPNEFSKMEPHYSLKTSTKKMPLLAYFQLINSPSLSWGTVLSISTDYADLHDLVEISKIINLVALDITAPLFVKPSANEGNDMPIAMLTDRLMRSWSELALRNEAFQNLRVLMLRLQPDITVRVFSYLDRFPSLEVLIAVGCPQFADESAKGVGERHGWLTRRVNATNKTVDECFRSYITSANGVDDSKMLEIGSLPVLEFSLGAPDVREYKKTHKSVWFHRQIRNSSAALSSGKRTTAPGDDNTATNAKRQRSKPVPKTQRNIDMAGLLAEFQRKYYCPTMDW
ncbi:hypothetical protein PABG_07437 [Paracoccidioides brasiliensis Pb03]|nr:hypothetical protein PABG_07437 [Paracoccidioides brasiliensis Pb03]